MMEPTERASDDLDAELALMLAVSGGPEGFVRSGHRELWAGPDHRGQRLPRRCRGDWEGNIASGLWLNREPD
ncbi:hypothetical protein P3T27_002131 [Kitasatospora sp. MAA19]|uniref:hypothetical protein n=1 Tax=unclassified Kitasatospora TaxID=2633591 RepID=UPI002474FD18|nr:hypothetical protein [Kitasatospora sp. MAA19]MDH6705421.1 hypothetical protein [Kitasatospora sp. MAA19]